MTSLPVSVLVLGIKKIDKAKGKKGENGKVKDN